MKTMIVIIAVLVAVVAFCALIIGIMFKLLTSYKQKLKTAKLQIAALNAVFGEVKKVKEETENNVASLNNIDNCVNYFRGNE